ncbi:hypothetical protein DHW03_09225 [Pedobacter yonginense]|uniref:DUF4369 domain-containing protein n=1 Tax=Pedobacter yonginense TaxID=651869 RepID=A0A317EP60_9SPHI|nr:hypothetical protein [Pedobacter yonginense]PWS27749.1 hypothetical protein DHW03_09225 [Pedobacter yonginense]
MKTICTFLICFTVTVCKAQLPAPELVTYITFENLKGQSDDYGTSIKPIGTGAFTNIADRNAMQSRMTKLKGSFRWPDGSTIDFSKRGSKSGKQGIVDVYTLTNPTSHATINLYVDPYKTDSTYYVPKGLIAVNERILEKEIAPYLKLVEEIKDSKDGYVDQKDNLSNLVAYLASNVGLTNFIDRENLAKVMTDTQAKDDVKNYLLCLYVVYKFYALGKNYPNPKIYALEQLKVSLANFQKTHSDIETGNIKINLN